MNPAGTGSTHFPYNSLSPLKLGRSATTIVGAAICFAQRKGLRELWGEMFVSLLLAMALSPKSRPRGTMPFLNRVFSGLTVPEEFFKALDEPIYEPSVTEGYFLSSEVLNILESARLLAIYSTRREEISIRHLLAGLLMVARDETLELFASYAQSVEISLEELVQHFIDYTVDEFGKDDKSVWLSQFRSGVNARLSQFDKRKSWKVAGQPKSEQDANKSATIMIEGVEGSSRT
jgi:hypothetical protein